LREGKLRNVEGGTIGRYSKFNRGKGAAGSIGSEEIKLRVREMDCSCRFLERK
jgi:hypothetical protein